MAYGYIALIALAAFCNAAVKELADGEVTLRLYNGADVDTYVEYNYDNAAEVTTSFGWNPALPTVIYIHGLTESADSESVQTVVKAYLGRADHNILALNYPSRAKVDLGGIVVNVMLVGQALGSILESLEAAGTDISTIHIVGFGLGPHVAANAARSINSPISRITGLDPALPAFYLGDTVHIEATDAKVVDIIHSDAGVLGAAVATGTADFYPNSGYPLQPGCNFPFNLKSFACGTNRAWQFYAESVTNPTAFPAILCDSWTQYKVSECSNIIDHMGFGFKNTANGTYYLETNKQSPFSKGIAGTKYDGSYLNILTARGINALNKAIQRLLV
ncbi:pancreatic triacylglycerol lipase [Cephus cinctus]|uniref:phospholipase A1 n=1 Tax=Cephus cinctus TaxID=211228 RepID=A0AAJ7C0D5_CEPCN|nr:pancreatic triacylglycerol lipase [Cephus cinctus]